MKRAKDALPMSEKSPVSYYWVRLMTPGDQSLLLRRGEMRLRLGAAEKDDRRNVQDRWIRANKVGGADKVGQVQPVQPMNR